MATLKEVYDAFKADGAPMPDTYEAFESFMTSGPNNGYDHRKEWYDAFKADGAPLPDTYEAFSAALFEPSRQPAVIADDNTGDAPQADQAQSSSPMSLPPTTGDRIRMLHGLNTLMKNGAAARKETVEQTRRVLERNTPKERAKIQSAEMQSRFMGMPTKPLGMRSGLPTPPPESDTDGGNEPAPRSMESPAPYGMVMDADGNPVQQWLLPDGTVTTDFLRADMAEYNARQARQSNMTLSSRLRDALTEQQRLDTLMRQRRAEIDAENNKHSVSSFLRGMADESHGMPGGMINDNGMRDYRTDEQYSQLESAARKNRQTIQTLSDKKNGRMNSFWHSFGTKLSDGYTLAEGLSEMNDAIALLQAKKQTDDINRKRKAGEELTQEEKTAESVLRDNAIYDKTQADFGGEYGAWARAGSMFATSLDLMKDIMLTPGAGTIAKGVASGVSKGLGKGIAKVVGNKVAENIATRFLTKATGILIGAHTAGAVVSNTAGIGHTLGEMSKEAAGNVVCGENGYEIVGRKGVLEALYDAERNQIRENGSEMFGEFIPGVGGIVMKGLERIGLKKVAGHLTDIGKKEWYQQYSGLLKSGGYNGLPGEPIEEYEGYLFDALTGHGADAVNELGDLNTHIDIWLGCATTGALLGSVPMVMQGAHTAMYYKYRHAAGKSDKAASVVLGDRWNDLRDRIDATPNEQMADVLTDIVANGGMTQRENTAILDYARNLSKMRGYNLAQMAVNEDGGEDDEGSAAVNDSYRDGYEASTPQEMNDARNAWEYQREQVKSVLSDDEIAGLDSNPAGALNEMRATGLYDMAQMDAALDYVNAKATYDGMIQSVRDDIDEKIAISDAMINGRVNQGTGMIQPAVMGLDDRQVYVVGGTLAVNDDGTIDRDASDESIVVRDAETGRLEFTDPKSIVSAGNAIDPEMERAIAIDNIRQQTAQSAVDAMNGTLAFNPGDVVPVNDGGGVVDVTIVGPAVDQESGMPVEGQVTVQFPNGQQTTFAKEQLQGFADAANLERFNAFERERSAARARQRTAEAEAGRPQFAINDEFTILNENGTPVRGSITGELDEDGTVEIYTEEPVDGKTVNHVTPAELERMLDTYNGKPVGAAVAVPENAETVPNPGVHTETGADTGENSTETVPNSDETVTGPQPSALSRIPVDGLGQPRYEDTDADTAWDAIVEQSAGDEATAAEVVADIVSERRADLKAAEKALDKVKEGKPEKRKKGDPAPTMEERIAAKNAAKAALSSAQADYDRAKSVLDHWELIAGTRQRRDDERRRAQEEEQRRLDAIAHDEAVARFEEQQRVKAEKQAEQERIGTHAVNPKIKEKWDGAPKIDGNSDAITLPDGSTLTGRYVLTEAGAASASHDVENAYMPTEGFPVDENGQSVNDRDYMRDKDAQRIVEGMADSYDSRALQDPVIVSNDGVVLSGNNRTMSGDLAAGRGTDRAYVDYLAQLGHRKYGFTQEQVTGMKNPRVVFVPDEALPYDAATFARFNAQEKKSQGKPEAAVKLGKIVPDNVFGDIVGAISRYDRLSDYYADEKAVAHALGALMQAGVINDRQMPEMRTGTALSAAGKELIENTLIGKVFQTSPDAVRQLISVPALRQSVVMGLNEIANNRTLAPNGYDISGELARAVDLVTQARSAMPDVYTTGVPVSPFGRMQGLFDDEFGDSRVTDGTVLLLADILNSGKPSDLRKVLTAYNNEASQSAGGQLDMFSGTIPTKEEILTTVNDHFRNATPKEQRALVDAAIAERKRRAAADTQQRGGLQADEQTPHDDERRAGPRQSAAERAERGGGVLPVAERGRQRNVSNPQRRQQDNLAEGEIVKSDETDDNGLSLLISSDGTTTFGEVRKGEGIESLPIKLSEGFNKVDAKGNNRGYGYEHIVAGHGDEIRSLGYKGVKSFVEHVSRNYDRILFGETRTNGVQTYILELNDNKSNVLYIQLSKDGGYWTVNSGGAFRNGYTKNKKAVEPLPAFEASPVAADVKVQEHGDSPLSGNSSSTTSSVRKVNDSASEKQEGAAESSLNARVKAAEAEVNTAPTPGQKEAGNYKKGHVQIGTFDVTIEQPVGSVRRGTDANGKEWATTMQNTYGYIRGTEGVDGDHIDVFLSTDIDAWNGRRVVIVDQYNPDGSFDEHKVMLGFNDKSDAVSAYLANYEKGWEKGRRLVFSTAALEDFEKWIESSHRKQKPYHEYKIAGKAEVDESTPGNPVSADNQPLSLDDMRQLTAEATAAKAAEREQPQSTDKVVNPSGNKLVTDERYAILRERMRKKLGGQLNMGVDPEILAIGAEMAVYHIEKGARKFKAYASAMIADLGDAIRPYLKAFYNAVRDMPEAEAAGLMADMDSYDDVRKVDIANFDKSGTDAMATAAAVVAEDEAEKQKSVAEKKLKEKRRKRRVSEEPKYSDEVTLKDGRKAVILYVSRTGDVIPGVETEPYKIEYHGQTRDGEMITFADEDVADGIEKTDQAPTSNTEKKPGRKTNNKSTPKPSTGGGLFDAIEDATEQTPAVTVPEPRPAADLTGDSAAFQEREIQTVELVEEIGSAIENRADMLRIDSGNVKPLTMTEVKKMAAKYSALKETRDTDLQELVELAMTQLTRSEALVNINGTPEQQRAAFDHIVSLYKIQPTLNARDSERLIRQQYSTPTPFGYVMGQFARAGAKNIGSMLEPSAGNGALTITVHPSLIHVNDIDDARLANLRKLGYGRVTAQDALLPFAGEQADVVMTNPPFGTVAEKEYDGIFHISSLEGQMAINALEQMKDDGRAAIIIGGNTSYRTNGSMNPKDAAFFGYLYSHYNVVDVINISGKALYSRNGTGYDVRMILIDGRKPGEFQRVFPPVKAKARAEQVTTFDELYKRVQDDIRQIQQVGSPSADVRREPGTAADRTAGTSVRGGDNRTDARSGQRPDTAGDVLGSSSRVHIAESASGHDGGRPAGVDYGDSGNAGGSDDVQRIDRSESRRGEQHLGVDNGRGRRGGDDRRDTAPSRPDTVRQRLAVKTGLGDEKVPYPNQSGNGFTLMSVVPAAQAQVLQKSLGEIGDVDRFLVDELGYSSKDELYHYLAAEQIDSVALAIHQMNKGNAFIIGDMTGVGKGRQGAALIRYAVRHGKTPIYFTQKPTLFTDNYRDLVDIGSSDLRPFIMASVDKERSGDIVDAEGKTVYKIPSNKEKERVYAHILQHGRLPEGYDYVLATYSQIQNGLSDYKQNEDGTWSREERKLPKKSKGYTPADHNGQIRRDALAKLADGNITILDESHTVGGDSGCGRYMQMLTSSADGVTFLSATFAKRADNMPIYAQRTAIAEAGIKASELIQAISKGGVTLQEIMSKQLVESGQMIRRERNFEGVTIDWLSVEEETDRRQREQFNEVAGIFNAIRNFQDEFITPLIDAKNDAAAEWGATIGHTNGTKDMGVKNVPFASKMYNLVNQLLFALKVDAVADRVIENLRNGYKPVISFTNTMEGFLSSAPKDVAMDEIPDFSITLLRALDGVMRFTEKDADKNSEGGSISLNELSVEGQNTYNGIREKIMNLSADLPISPMDAIRMKVEEAGYTIAEITGRELQLNRTADGKYIVESRKDRDKKAAMRDFNSGKLDVLMINKSGSTGISLHASSKFEDQRPRVMVFAQFQSDINDEVQMRGRIDRSGQVTRGRYEYIMSTIPAEQRIQMMFKAKLKSLDANTTSSQKSKFNEMEIVDYLNKYGDEVVWEYMKEHPELEERLGDPLEILQGKSADDAPRASKKEDTSKKADCAGKISRYLAFLPVEEQDEIFKEITDAYKVKIQLLDDAGENDLEITTMPLRAETKRKRLWHEGVNPGSGNAFADNTYVEEVEADVLKKPMKRDEIAKAVRKLMGEHYAEKNGGVDWGHFARAKSDEISLYYHAKADETVDKLKAAGETRIAKAREKAVNAALKARGRGENNFTDEEIMTLADNEAKVQRTLEVQKQNQRLEEILGVKNRIQALLKRFHAEGIYVVPQDLKQGTPEMFSQTFGTFIGFKFNKTYTLGSSTAIFATLDGRRKVELALNDPALNTIISATETAYRYSPKEIGAISMENWDSKVPTQTRQKRYIITGNLLQALVDTEKGDKTRGNLISYSTLDGDTRQGILMGENFKPGDLRNSASFSSRLAQIREGAVVVSEHGDVQVEKVSVGWQHRGQYELRVPKSKQRGGKYTMYPGLLKLVEDNNFITKGNSMVAYVPEANIARVVDMLSRAPFNLTVLEKSKLSDVSAEGMENETLYRLDARGEDVISDSDMEKLDAEMRKEVEEYLTRHVSAPLEVISADDIGALDLIEDEAAELTDIIKTGEIPAVYFKRGKKIYIFAGVDRGTTSVETLLNHENIHATVDTLADREKSARAMRDFRESLLAHDTGSQLFARVYSAIQESNPVDMHDEEFFAYTVSWGMAKPTRLNRILSAVSHDTAEYLQTNIINHLYGKEHSSDNNENRTHRVSSLHSAIQSENSGHTGGGRGHGGAAASTDGFRRSTAETGTDLGRDGRRGERGRDSEIVNRMGDGYGAYSDTEVSYANDPVSKALGKNRFSRKRQAEFAAQERARMVMRIEELAGKLHLDKSRLDIVTDVSQLKGNRAKAKGFYNKRTGKITIVIPNNASTIDVEQTLLHEAVAHYGLRKLFGKQFDTFLDNVYESADESIRRKIAKMAAQNGWNFRTATEEYLAGLAEDTNFAEAKSYGGWWTKIKSLFLDMLESIGFEGFRDKTGVVLTDNELRYILWRSYENLAEPGLYRSILGEAADVAKQAELKVGNYAEKGIEAEYAAEPNNIDEVNDRFNQELQQQIDGSLPEGHVYEMGMPSKYLRSTGIENLPIRLSAKVLNIKSNLDRHKYSLATVKNLVKAIQQPWAIFAYGEKNKAQNLIIGIEDNGRQFLVGLSINPTVKGRSLEINSIRNVFPKNNHEWVNWINEGKLLRVDGKKEIQAVIAKLRMNPVAFDYLDLDNAAKIVENFENPTIEEEDLFRPGDFTPRDRVTARDTYNRICASRGYQFQEAVQDSMLGLKELYRAILGRKTRIEDVAGFENAYLFENRMSGTNGSEQHEYYLRYMKPLLKEIGRIAGANQRKRKELTDYLMAKHGLERNEYMRKEAAAKGENTDRDFAGLIGLTGEPDWQSAEATARQWVDDYEKMVDTTKLWQAVNNATKATLEKVYLSGIISKETYGKILGMYQYYIPLRGWDETTSEQVYGYLMSKEGPLGGNIMKKAQGRESMADDPIATLAMMADDAIRQGNRNLMKQRFLNFVLNYPSDAVSVHDLWLEYDDVNDEWRPVFADVKDTDTAEEVEQKVEAFEQRMETLRTADPDKYKKGREAQHIPYKVVRGNLKEHQVFIKRNGRTFVVTVNGNPRAAQALNGLTNPDVDQNGVVGNMLKAGEWINRQLSAGYTTRNPVFGVKNFFRDMLFSNCMTWIKESPRYALRFHYNFGKFNPITMRRLLRKWENGTLDQNNPTQNMFYQFMKNGGETGYTIVRDIASHKRAVAAELKKQGSVSRKVWTALGMQLDLLNRSAENCARFAAFVTSREFGRKIDRSIYDAKEVSVNFNKKGSGGKMVNANGQTTLGKAGAYLGGGGRLLYLFWNVGIQAMTAVGRQAKRHPGKFMTAASAMFTLGYVIPMLAEMAGGGNGDDDDKNAYYNLPEYVRRSNICFRAGDQWIIIPLPVEFSAIYGMGELAHGVISGNERYSNAELGYQMAAQVSQILPIDMLEGGGGVSPFIPSAAKPTTEAYIMNKSWTGMPIYKDTPFNKNDPEWTKAYASTDKHLVAFAKWLNETSGGDDFTKGAIDINPAKIEYVLKGTFGGVVTFPLQAKKTIETVAGNREFEWRNLIFASALVTSGDERTANRKLQNEYFKYKEEYEETGRRWRKYTNADSNGVLGYAEKIDFLENSPEFLRHEIFDDFRADIDANQNMLAQETDEQKRAELEKEIFALKRRLVDALHDPAEYFRQLYESGQLSDEYIKYLEKNHGIKLENAKQ